MWALLIGINSYPNFGNEDQLDGCLNDCALVENILTDFCQSTNTELKITKLTDNTREKPTRENILNCLEQIYTDCTQDELVFIHYAGHGSRCIDLSKSTYQYETIVPQDSGREPKFPNKDIADFEIHEYLERLSGKTSKIVLNFDCCHSGSIARELTPSATKTRSLPASSVSVEQCPKELLRKREENKGENQAWLPVSEKYVLLAACRSTEKAHECSHPSKPGEKVGAWTKVFCQTINQFGAKIEKTSYRKILEKACILMAQDSECCDFGQQPLVEGNVDCVFLGAELLPYHPTIRVVDKNTEGELVKISAGSDHGIEIGTKFLICHEDAVDRDPGSVICTGVVEEVSFAYAWLAVGYHIDRVDVGSLASEIAEAGRKYATLVNIDTSGDPSQFVEEREKIVKHIATNPLLLDASRYQLEVEGGSRKLVTILMANDGPTDDATIDFWHTEPSYFLIGETGELESAEPISIKSGTEQLLQKLDKLAKFHLGLSILESSMYNPLARRVQLELLRRQKASEEWQVIEAADENTSGSVKEGQLFGARITNSSSQFLFVALLEFAENGEVNQLFPPEGGEQLLGINKSETISIGKITKVASIKPFPSETFKLFASVDRFDLSMLTQQEGFRGGIGSTLQFLNSFRLVGDAVENIHWITCQQEVILERKDEATQLWIKFFSASSSLAPKDFVIGLFASLGNETGVTFHKFRKHLIQQPSFNYVFKKMAIVCNESFDNNPEVMSFQRNLCRTVFDLLQEKLNAVNCRKTGEMFSHSLMLLLLKSDDDAEANHIESVLDKWLQVINSGEVHGEETMKVVEEVLRLNSTLTNEILKLFCSIVVSRLVMLASASYNNKEGAHKSANCLTVGITANYQLKKQLNLTVIPDQYVKVFSVTTTELLERAGIFLQNIGNEKMNNEMVRSSLQLIQIVFQYLEQDPKIPWQDGIIKSISTILESSHSKCSPLSISQCHRLLGEAYCKKLSGKRDENLKKGIQHLINAQRLFIEQGNSWKAMCQAVNFSLYIGELDNISPEMGELTNWKPMCIEVLTEIINNPKAGILRAVAVQNLMMFLEPSYEMLQSCLQTVDEKTHGRHAGKLHLNIAWMKLRKCQSEHFHPDETMNRFIRLFAPLKNTKWLPMFYQRYADFICPGQELCCHDASTEQHLKDAMRLLTDSNGSHLEYIQALALCGQFHATDCRIPTEQRFKEALKYFSVALARLDTHWPSHGAAAQINAIQDFALALWEDMVDIAYSVYKFTEDSENVAKLIKLLQTAKGRNILLAGLTQQFNLAKCNSVLNWDSDANTSWFTDNSSENLDFEFFPLHEFLENLDDADTVVEWWISFKGYTICFVYNKEEGMRFFKTLACEDTLDMLITIQEICESGVVYSCQLEKLSQVMAFQELVSFVHGNFSRAKKLILVPHRFLNFVPLHLVPCGAGSKLFIYEFTEGISFLPNSAFLRNRSSVVDCGKKELLLFQADPHLDLRYSLEEVQNIQSVVSEHSDGNTGGSRLFSKASKKQFISELSESSVRKIVHIACHGYWDSDESNSSYLLFEDGKLHLPELSEVNFASCHLTVLSACSTGFRDATVSQMVDGYIGFGAHLLASGCRNVILALAPVEDRLTSEFMLGFYRNMVSGGMPVSKAFCGALITHCQCDADKDTIKRLVKVANESIKQRVHLPFIHVGLD